MTLSTVGYGDISPNTTEEKIFTIVVIFTGVSGYAMLIQAIGTAMTGDPNKLSHTKAMRNYLYDYEVPPALAEGIRPPQISSVGLETTVLARQGPCECATRGAVAAVLIVFRYTDLLQARYTPGASSCHLRGSDR